MTPFEIGTKLVALCQAGNAAEAITTLYAPNIVSVEALALPGGERESTGIPACLEKGKAFRDRHEIHSASIAGPFPHDERFAVVFRYDATVRATGHREEMSEVALYTVKSGKIVREEFFYGR